MPTSRRPRRGPSSRPHAGGHGYVHVPRDERRPAGRCPACAASWTAASRRHLRVRSRSERCRRHLRLVRRAAGSPAYHPRPSGAVSTSMAICRSWQPFRTLATRSGRAGLAQRQPVGPRRPRAQRGAGRCDAEHPARRHLSGLDRGDRVRHPAPSSRRSRPRVCRSTGSSSPAGLKNNPMLMRCTPTSCAARCTGRVRIRARRSGRRSSGGRGGRLRMSGRRRR